MPILEMRKPRFSDIESPDHSHRAGCLPGLGSHPHPVFCDSSHRTFLSPVCEGWGGSWISITVIFEMGPLRPRGTKGTCPQLRISQVCSLLQVCQMNTAKESLHPGPRHRAG